MTSKICRIKNIERKNKELCGRHLSLELYDTAKGDIIIVQTFEFEKGKSNLIYCYTEKSLEKEGYILVEIRGKFLRKFK